MPAAALACYKSGMASRRPDPLRILVATDGSRGATAALRFAASLAARAPSAALTVVTIASDVGRASSALTAAAKTLRQRKVRSTFEIAEPRREETIPEAIVREADRRKADLVIVGSEGRDTLREWVVGGTALRLIYLARRPVVVVRPPRSRRRP
jgi:nucleotide-binding universal stress UspA family protein